MISASRRAGYSEGELLAAGLASRRRDGSGLLDRFRGRIMFPLADPKGHVLGFGARALSPDDQPKYLNTSESDLFHKGSLVYGADLARGPAARTGRLVLVEGYTDVIALRQAGIPETVCSMGTALTDRQLDALKRLTPKVLLCQDPDAAGQEAVAKGKDAIRAFNESHRLRGFDLRVVRLPPGQDPADVVQREGAEAMRALLETSVPVPRFEVERALGAADLGTPDGREDALRAVAPVVASLDPGPAAVRPHPADRQPTADAGGDDPGGAEPRAAVERPRRRAGRRGHRRRSTGARRPSARSSPAASRSRTPAGGRSRRWTSRRRSRSTSRGGRRTICPSTSSIRARRCRPAPRISPGSSRSSSSRPATSPPIRTRSSWSGSCWTCTGSIARSRLHGKRGSRWARSPQSAQRVRHDYEHRQSANLSARFRGG